MRFIIDEVHFTKTVYPFTKKPIFSALEFKKEISRKEPLNSFLPNDCIKNLLGFDASTIYEKKTYHLFQSTSYHLIIFFSNEILLMKTFVKVKNLEKLINLEWMLILGIYTLRNSEAIFNIV